MNLAVHRDTAEIVNRYYWLWFSVVPNRIYTHVLLVRLVTIVSSKILFLPYYVTLTVKQYYLTISSAYEHISFYEFDICKSKIEELLN